MDANDIPGNDGFDMNHSLEFNDTMDMGLDVPPGIDTQQTPAKSQENLPESAT